MLHTKITYPRGYQIESVKPWTPVIAGPLANEREARTDNRKEVQRL